jgi:cytochrome c peroxidase
VTRLDFLLSRFALRRADGSWFAQPHGFACVSARQGRTSFRLEEVPAGAYDLIRFHVGVPPEENHADPATFAAGHPLNPIVNGLHWSWQGGYVFLAIEGNWLPRGGASPAAPGGYSWHLATDPLLTIVELPVRLNPADDRGAILVLNVDRLFSKPHGIALDNDTTSTHSRPGDALAGRLRENLGRAFGIEVRKQEASSDVLRLNPATSDPASQGGGWLGREQAPLLASNATPRRFTYSKLFPQPALPADNPLTEEGVELGRRLFHDPRLSRNDNQSCASCHQVEAAFSDRGKRFSLGTDGLAGTRNAMPLFNLAWRQSFFWDGRAPSLREQVLLPIQNPIEMHETLSNVLAKLQAGQTVAGCGPDATEGPDAAAFTRAFGSPDITADRIARALEQFLLAQVSCDAKFDRALQGKAEFTEEEKRGFELFHSEYDPRRGQFGADCFHCHGAPLFQSQGFANNGLDAAPADPGRYEVSRAAGDRGKFAVPSLRNVAVTAPYMHDGRFATLEEVVAHYASGVKRSDTLDPNLAKHPDGGVPLSATDKRALVAFLRTLTDERFISQQGR